jgi:hypothetical protein
MKKASQIFERLFFMNIYMILYFFSGYKPFRAFPKFFKSQKPKMLIIKGLDKQKRHLFSKPEPIPIQYYD